MIINNIKILIYLKTPKKKIKNSYNFLLLILKIASLFDNNND